MSWWRSRRFSAATTARGAKNLQDGCDNVAKELDHRAILGVSQVQPRRARALYAPCIEFLRRTGRPQA
jgi:hypothetical protein